MEYTAQVLEALVESPQFASDFRLDTAVFQRSSGSLADFARDEKTAILSGVTFLRSMHKRLPLIAEEHSTSASVVDIGSDRDDPRKADSLEGVTQLLSHRNRHDLAQLLQCAWLELDQSDQYGSYHFSALTTARLHVPIKDYERLRTLPDLDKNEILQTLLEIYPPRDHSIEITNVEFVVDTSTKSERQEDLIKEIEAQRSLMIAVATGGPRIQSVNTEYQERRERLGTMFAGMNIADPNPFPDLWAWYGKWSSGDLPSYRSRRQFISELYGPLTDRLKRGTPPRASGIFEDHTGWVKIDRTVNEIRQGLERASTEEQFQAIGLLCREAIISLAQTVFDAKKHKILDDVVVSPTDGKRMLEAYLAAELGGTANKVARQHAKAALDLANELQHKRTAVFRQAALCAEATAAVINLIAIISGRRDP